MADYAISNVPRRVVFAASGIGPYAFTFEILAQTDIAVYKDDTLLTLTTDYTVVINSNGTGSITLTTAPTGATQIAIVGARAIQRTTDFTTGGDFFANTVNDELDSLTIFAQQNAEGVARALSAPQTDPTSIDMTLPRASERAGKYLTFDVNGNPEAGIDAVEVAGVYAIRDDITAVAAIDTEVVTVANNDANVTTVAGSITNVNAVGGSIANVNKVAGEVGVGGDVTIVATDLAGTNTVGTVATNIANVNKVGTDIVKVVEVADNLGTGLPVTVVAADLSGVDNIGTVAGSIANVNITGSNIANVNAVAGNATNINAVASNATNINTVSTNIANVNATGSNIANVNSVAGNATNINAVVANATNINTVASINANVTKVANIDANVTKVANIDANVTTVAGISSNVTTVAGISTNVSTVAGINASVTAVASNATNINAVAGNATNINAVAANNSSVTTVATNVTNVNTVAANIVDIGTVAGINADISTVADISTNVTTVAGVAGDLSAVALTVAPVESLLPVGFDIPNLWWDTGDRLLSGSSERMIISNWQVTSLFDTEDGAWYDTYDASELGGATSPGDTVPSFGDKSGNSNGATGTNVLYATVPRPALYNNKVSSRMIVDLPYLGTDCTIAYCSDQGVTILSGVTVGGPTDILHDRYLFGYVVIDRALTTQEVLRLTQYLESRKFGYVAPAEYDGAMLLEDGFSLLMENSDRVDLEGVITWPLSV